MTTNKKPTKKENPVKRLFNKPGKPYWNSYLGGVLLGTVLFLSYLITGQGLGASGGISRYVVSIQDLFVPGHIDQVPYLISMAGGEKNPLDSWIVMVSTGVIIGGFISGLINGRAKFETNKGPNISNRKRWLFAFVGGIFFVYGARLARGCTSGQALSGGATLAAGSWVVMFAIFGGAYALAYTVRKLWN